MSLIKIKPVAKTQDEINKESLAYLASTDWYSVRFVDTGIAIPANVQQNRQEARARIVK